MLKQMLAAVDGSEKCLKALQVMGGLVKDLPEYGILCIHCMPQLQSLYSQELVSTGDPQVLIGEIMEKAGRKILDQARSSLRDIGFPEERIETKLKKDSSVPSCDILNEAGALKIRTVVCGRRGNTPKKNLLVGSVASRLAQYGNLRTVWVVDAPVHDTRKVLVTIEGAPDSRALTYYAAEFLAPIPNLEYTLLHLLPKLPPSFWDHGHILSREEEKQKDDKLGKWQTENLRDVEKFLSEAADALIGCGVPKDKVKTSIVQTRNDVAMDILDMIDRMRYQIVLVGKKNFRENKPFLIGSNANKILKNAKNTILCLVDS